MYVSQVKTCKCTYKTDELNAESVIVIQVPRSLAQHIQPNLKFKTFLLCNSSLAFLRKESSIFLRETHVITICLITLPNFERFKIILIILEGA